jgi:hypothetical protein
VTLIASVFLLSGLSSASLPSARTRVQLEAAPVAALGSLDPRLLRLAQNAASCAGHMTAVGKPRLLTIIDYSRPSTTRRLWVVDREREAVIYEELVAHGRDTGDNLAQRFSNEPGSHQSSLGLFLTADTYFGRNGYSLRLKGLEPGVNDRALERAIVMHGAPYVAQGIEKTRGRLGRSWGCPALRSAIAREVIDTIKEGSLVFAYYPDQRWLQSSRFVACSAASDGVAPALRGLAANR